LKNLLTDINSNVGKVAWQLYTLNHGIETLEVLVPLQNSPRFELAMRQPHPTKQSVIETLRACGGELK
jgi:hypothetical protein